MKHLKRVLSVILTAAMLLTMVPFAVSAAAADNTYDVSLFSEDFSNVSDGAGILAAGLTYKPDNEFHTVGIADDPASVGEHGNTVKIAKYASDADDEGADIYFRIDYDSKADNITTRFDNAPEVLANVKASMDIYMPEDFSGYNIRFYDATSGSTKGDNLATVSRITDKTGTVKARVSFMNGNSVTLDINTWYTFEFYVNAAAGTYSAAINGEEKATYCAITDTDKNGNTLDVCVASFGIQKNQINDPYTIYLDNFKFEIP
ncbi:MAG: hypothetical protein IJ365_03440, partial [Clostridia bacterium]|nr:hypothetical protein [Clostridia bacterium]MBQ8587753.1 hypothetical protein [Clostridia bacterium]